MSGFPESKKEFEQWVGFDSNALNGGTCSPDAEMVQKDEKYRNNSRDADWSKE